MCAGSHTCDGTDWKAAPGWRRLRTSKIWGSRRFKALEDNLLLLPHKLQASERHIGAPNSPNISSSIRANIYMKSVGLRAGATAVEEGGGTEC